MVLAGCAPGSTPTSAGCIPDGLGVTECSALDSRPCTRAGQECHFYYWSCECAQDGDVLKWRCIGLL